MLQAVEEGDGIPLQLVPICSDSIHKRWKRIWRNIVTTANDARLRAFHLLKESTRAASYVANIDRKFGKAMH